MLAVAWPLAPVITAAFGASPGVAHDAVIYLRISLLGAPAMLIVLAGTGVLRGLQDTRTPLGVSVAANTVNIALNAAFVLGLGWGIAGPPVRSLLLAVLVAVALQQPVAGVVFVLDGVLIGAGDQRYLAVAGIVTLAVFLPAAAFVLTSHRGLVALWLAYSLWIAARFATLTLRARGRAWLVTGPVRR